MRVRSYSLLLGCMVSCAGMGAVALAAPAGAGAACSNEALRTVQHAGFLPDCRAYEMVSPPDKNGGDVIADSQRTRSAVDGGAVGFESLTGFAGLQGTGVSSDYLSVRSSSSSPGDNGWSTHGITPPMRSASATAIFASLDSSFQGDFSPDLERGVLTVWGSLEGNPYVDGVANLYRESGLRKGAGTFDLATPCSLCEEETFVPLPAYPRTPRAVTLKPVLAASTADLNHVVFESLERLTGDTPEQPAQCNMSLPSVLCRAHVYEWDNGAVGLAGRVPVSPASECDDVSGPACVAADVSIAGQGTGLSRPGSNNRTPHIVGMSPDGHVRVFFTQPTNEAGETSSEKGDSPSVNRSFSGRVFMRVDGRSTVQLNVSVRAVPDVPAPAQLLDGSVDGSRVFFTSSEALTEDAPEDGSKKLYMYETTKPANDSSRLTLLTPSGGGVNVLSTVGISDDGHYLYFVGEGEVVKGTPALPNGIGFYLWHDGALSFAGAAPLGTALNENVIQGSDWGLALDQARVTPDGRHLLFSTNEGADLLNPPYDHGTCSGGGLGGSCRELYLYSVDGSTATVPDLACVSCNPSGAPASTMATDSVWANAGAAVTTYHLNRAISVDGSRVFFTTGEGLVAQDTNGRKDAYEWTENGTHGCHDENQYNHGCLSLLSNGTGPSDSYFLDASPDGDNAFVVVHEQLVGWDTDRSYDLYDARVGGGFPEPPAPPGCASGECQSAGPVAVLGAPVSASFVGPGNPTPAGGGSKAKPLTRAQRLARALRACHRQRSRKRRRRCEATAHRRYGKAAAANGRGK